MAKQKSTGLLVNGSVKAAGVTFYTRHGQTVVRSARSVQPERRSRGQFDQRMRMRHTIALWHVFVRLFNLKFVNCYVEGIRSDYKTMGYGAAANAVLKGFPYLEAWDFRMDWCRDKDLYTQGTLCARTNLCRVFFLLLAAIFYAGILFLSFWRRRSRVLKTGELPELGFIRKKIVGWMTEE